tara:strand:+ start:431 stop:643 length:213 start_codon:yes stop_codon:yes gene_type:complete
MQEYMRVMQKVAKDEADRPTHIVIRKYGVNVVEVNKVRAKKGWTLIQIFLPPLVTPTPGNVIQSKIQVFK